MPVLPAAIKLGTGISGLPKERATSSRYVQPALQLIDVWEFLTATRYCVTTIGVIKRYHAKKTKSPSRPKGKDQKYLTKQPSTKLISIALHMINPNIRDAEVFTAIKNALTERDSLYDYIQRKLDVRKSHFLR